MKKLIKSIHLLTFLMLFVFNGLIAQTSYSLEAKYNPRNVWEKFIDDKQKHGIQMNTTSTSSDRKATITVKTKNNIKGKIECNDPYLVDKKILLYKAYVTDNTGDNLEHLAKQDNLYQRISPHLAWKREYYSSCNLKRTDIREYYVDMTLFVEENTFGNPFWHWGEHHIPVDITLTLEGGVKLSDIGRINLPGIGDITFKDFANPRLSQLREILEDPKGYPNYVMLAAHRGYWKYAPENSLEAFKNAIDFGADIVEIDLKLTADKKFMVIHDNHLGRLTDTPKMLKNPIFLKNGTASFQKINFHEFTYTIQTEDKFFISFYNPNGATNWQLRMDLSKTGKFTQIGGNGFSHTHDEKATSEWAEVSVDLSAYVGEDITKIQIFPAAAQGTVINFGNIYINSSSVSSVNSSATYFFRDNVVTGSIIEKGVSKVTNISPNAVNSSVKSLQTDGEGYYLLNKMKFCDLRPDLCPGNPGYNIDNPNNCNTCSPTLDVNNKVPVRLRRPNGEIAEKLPTLEEAFDLFLENPSVLIDIDKIPKGEEYVGSYFDEIYKIALKKNILDRIIIKVKVDEFFPNALKASTVIDWSKWYVTPIIFPDSSCFFSKLNCVKAFMDDPEFNCPGVEYIYFNDNEPDFEEVYGYIRETMNNRVFQFPTYPENGAGMWVSGIYIYSDKTPKTDRLNDWNWLLQDKRRPDVIISDRFELLLNLLTNLGLRQK